MRRMLSKKEIETIAESKAEHYTQGNNINITNNEISVVDYPTFSSVYTDELELNEDGTIGDNLKAAIADTIHLYEHHIVLEDEDGGKFIFTITNRISEEYTTYELLWQGIRETYEEDVPIVASGYGIGFVQYVYCGYTLAHEHSIRYVYYNSSFQTDDIDDYSTLTDTVIAL